MLEALFWGILLIKIIKIVLVKKIKLKKLIIIMFLMKFNFLKKEARKKVEIGAI